MKRIERRENEVLQPIPNTLAATFSVIFKVEETADDAESKLRIPRLCNHVARWNEREVLLLFFLFAWQRFDQ
jgi:hypothetical protein